MTNKEFAELVAASLQDIGNLNKEYIENTLLNILRVNCLEVICTNEQLLGYSVDDVKCCYEGNRTSYLDRYKKIPDTLSKKEAEYILQLADIIASKHGEGFSYKDIDEAIEQWLENGS